MFLFLAWLRIFFFDPVRKYQVIPKASVSGMSKLVESTILIQLCYGVPVSEVFLRIQMASIRSKAPFQFPKSLCSWIHEPTPHLRLRYRSDVGRQWMSWSSMTSSLFAAERASVIRSRPLATLLPGPGEVRNAGRAGLKAPPLARPTTGAQGRGKGSQMDLVVSWRAAWRRPGGASTLSGAGMSLPSSLKKRRPKS